MSDMARRIGIKRIILEDDLKTVLYHASRGRSQNLWPPGKNRISVEFRKNIIDAFNIIGENVDLYLKSLIERKGYE